MRKIGLLLSILLSSATPVWAQNTVFFDNQSGELALVKLVGPTSTEIEVPNSTKQAVQAAGGCYTIKVRYGTPGRYHYAKGEEFEVKETATTRSEITITLHKVVAGNYESQPISETDFQRDARIPTEPQKGGAKTTSPPSIKSAVAWNQNTLALLEARIANKGTWRRMILEKKIIPPEEIEIMKNSVRC